MDRFWTFVNSMTLWNWLALIAFIFFPLSALNAFFSLRARFLDWRATSSKKEFPVRLERLNSLLVEAVHYRRNTSEFFIRVLYDAMWPVLSTFLGIICFVGAFYRGVIYRPETKMSHILAVIANNLSVLAFFIAAFLFLKLTVLVRNVKKPEFLGSHILNYISESKANNVIPDDSKPLIKEIIDSEVLPGSWTRELEKELDL
jgi:hypothetical protein